MKEQIKNFFLKFSYTQKMMAVFFLISATVLSNVGGILATHYSLYNSLNMQVKGLPLIYHLRSLGTNLIKMQLDEQTEILQNKEEIEKKGALLELQKELLLKIASQSKDLLAPLTNGEKKNLDLQNEIDAFIQALNSEKSSSRSLKQLFYEQKKIRKNLQDLLSKTLSFFELNLNIDSGTARLIDLLLTQLPSIETKLPEMTALLSNQASAPWINLDREAGLIGLKNSLSTLEKKTSVQLVGIESELKSFFQTSSEDKIFPLASHLTKLIDDIQKTIEQSLTEKVEDATKIVFSNSSQLIFSDAKKTLETIDSFYSALDTKLFQLIEAQKSTLFSRMMFGIFILFLGGLLAFLLYFTRIMRRPISQIKNAAVQLSQGDLSIRIKPDYQDEVSEMAISFNGLADYLSNVLKNAMLIAETLTGNIQTIYELALKLEKNAEAEEKELPLIAFKTNEMAEIAKRFDADLTGVYKTISSNTALANEGRESLREMGDLIEQMVGSSDTIAKALSELKLKVAKINNVIKAIVKVADQINLLSLNTAIRASRAGEEGKGFSVIAHKISELASHTAHATLDIEKTVGQIIDTVSVSIGKVEKFTDKTSEQQLEATALGNELKLLIDFFQKQIKTFETLSDDIETHTDKSIEIRYSIASLSDSARRTNLSMHSLYAEIELLYHSSIELLAQLRQFKYP